jgi:hypothetical protein
MEATPEDLTPPLAEEAGPLSHINYDSLESPLVSPPSPPQNPGSEENSEQNGEQALESHEVMELQAFSERKEWIVDKIKVCSFAQLSRRFLLNDKTFWTALGGHASHRPLCRP